MYHLKNTEMIFVFTGPDSSGRKTVSKLVAENTLQMKGVISYTTRDRRHYEVDGKDYHFITEEEFKDAEAKGEFLESVNIEGNYYGVKVKDIRDSFADYGCIYLVLDKEGAQYIKELYGDKVVRIFIYADRNTVIERRRERGDDEETIIKRIAYYDVDMSYKEKCEYAFENYRYDHTAFDIIKTIEKYFSERSELQEDPAIEG